MDRATVAHPAPMAASSASGQGAAAVTAALARLHMRQGRRVRVFKCGPNRVASRWPRLACDQRAASLLLRELA